eukprot:scaffold12716_cov136-Isochrysis_galbana.AAC.1
MFCLRFDFALCTFQGPAGSGQLADPTSHRPITKLIIHSPLEGECQGKRGHRMALHLHLDSQDSTPGCCSRARSFKSIPPLQWHCGLNKKKLSIRCASSGRMRQDTLSSPLADQHRRLPSPPLPLHFRPARDLLSQACTTVGGGWALCST